MGLNKRVNYRRYIQHHRNKPVELLTWIQRRCIICQRFLSKKQQKYCFRCSKKVIYLKNVRRSQKRKYSKNIIRELVNIKIPRFLYKIIESYV